MRKKPNPPEVGAERCTGCGLCVRACPSFVLEMSNGQALVHRGEACIGCGHCGAICPVEAIVQREASVEHARKSGRRPAISTTTLQRLLRERRSVRLYRVDSIQNTHLEKIIEAGRYAPTGTNSQNVHYVVMTSPAEIAKLREKTEVFYEKLFRRAGSKMGGLLISLAAGRKTLETLRGYLPMVEYIRALRGREVDPLLHHARAVMMVHAESWDTCSAFNCAVALYNCALMAHTLGVGSCFNGFVENAANHDRRIKNWLKIPKDHRCFGAMTLGYPEVHFQRLIERHRPRVQWR